MALGIFICKPPWSFGKVKRAVDVFGDICRASLLHLTKAAVSFLNSFSGQVIAAPSTRELGTTPDGPEFITSSAMVKCLYNRATLFWDFGHIFWDFRSMAKLP